MIGRAARIGLEVLAGLFALALIAALILVWRLSSGPVPLDFLAPYIQSALERVAAGHRVEAERIDLVWTGWEEAFEVQALGIRLLDPEGRLAAAVPRASIDLSLRALFQGTLAPTSVALFGVRLELQRRADGSIGLGGGGQQTAPADGAPADLSPVLDDLLPGLFGKEEEGTFSYLERFAVRSASLRLVDERLGLAWQAPHATLAFERAAAGVTGKAILDLDLAGDRAALTVDLLYRQDGGPIEARARLDGMKPDSLAGMSEKLALLRGIEVPLTASFEASLDQEGRLLALAFEATGERGVLRRPELVAEPVETSYAAASGRYDGASGELLLESATLQLGGAEDGPVIEGGARLAPQELGLGLVIEARLNNLKVLDLARYWPQPLSPNARDWVTENLTEGFVGDGSLSAMLFLPPEGEAQLRQIGGGFAYENLEVHYLRPMPPMTGLAGRAEFGPDSLRFAVERGQSGSLAVTGGTVEIVNLAKGDEIEEITIKTTVEGPFEAALALLDHPRLALLSNIGLDPGEAAGSASTALEISFPLKKDLLFEDVTIAAQSRIAEAVARDLVLGQDLTDGSLALTATEERMEITGTFALGGVPMQGTWQESFIGKDPVHRLNLEIKRLDDKGRATFGLEAGDLLKGPVAGRLVLAADRRGNGRAEVQANLAEAQLAFNFFGWEKAGGAPGEARFVLELSGWEPKRVRKLSLEAGDLSLQGGIDFSKGKFARAALSRVTLGRTRFAEIEITPFSDGGVAARAKGGVLDLSGLALRGGTKGTGVGRRPQGVTILRAERFTPLRIEAEGLERLLLGPDRFLENVTVEMLRESDGWRRIVADGAVPRAFWRHGGRKVAEDAGLAAKRFSFKYGPAEGGYSLLFNADDMGAALRALGILDTLEGGRLQVTGRLPGPLPNAPLKAQIDGGEFRIVEAPVLGRILTLASFTGVAAALSGEGIAFERLTGDFHLEEDMATSELMRAYGASLGVTAKGRLDFAGDKTAIVGTVVPAYTVNRILGQIPLLGPIITGGEGEGLLAVTYGVTGPIDDLEVSVNPLSALAPGFLRGLFGVSTGGGEDSESPSALPRSGMER